MARYNRRRYYNRRPQQNLSWFPVDMSKALGTAGNKTFLVANSEDRQFDVVCERQRGIVQLYNAGSGTFSARGVLYSIVLPDIILGNSNPGDEITGEVPSPLDGEGTDDFPLWHPVCSQSGHSMMFDSKAKRKIGKDELLSLCFRLDSAGGSSGSASVGLAVLGRCLFKWKI